MWMKRRKHIGVCRMFWLRTPGQSAFYTHCVLSVWRWPGAISLIPTRTSGCNTGIKCQSGTDPVDQRGSCSFFLQQRQK